MTLAQAKLEPGRWTFLGIFCPSCGRFSLKWLRVEGVTHRKCHKCDAFLRVERTGQVLTVKVTAR